MCILKGPCRGRGFSVDPYQRRMPDGMSGSTYDRHTPGMKLPPKGSWYRALKDSLLFRYRCRAMPPSKPGMPGCMVCATVRQVDT